MSWFLFSKKETYDVSLKNHPVWRVPILRRSLGKNSSSCHCSWWVWCHCSSSWWWRLFFSGRRQCSSWLGRQSALGKDGWRQCRGGHHSCHWFDKQKTESHWACPFAIGSIRSARCSSTSELCQTTGEWSCVSTPRPCCKPSVCLWAIVKKGRVICHRMRSGWEKKPLGFRELHWLGSLVPLPVMPRNEPSNIPTPWIARHRRRTFVKR